MQQEATRISASNLLDRRRSRTPSDRPLFRVGRGIQTRRFGGEGRSK